MQNHNNSAYLHLINNYQKWLCNISVLSLKITSTYLVRPELRPLDVLIFAPISMNSLMIKIIYTYKLADCIGSPTYLPKMVIGPLKLRHSSRFARSITERLMFVFLNYYDCKTNAFCNLLLSFSVIHNIMDLFNAPT